MSKERVESFSDGVFAIVLTLLVLELQVPSIPAHANISEYLRILTPLLPKVISFVLTFAIICFHWVNHHYFSRQIKAAPIGLVWLNNLFLLWICFMPFPTALLGSHPTDQFPILLYAANQLLAALTTFVIRIYATRNNLFSNPEMVKVMGPRHSFPAMTLLLLSIVFAFVNVYLSLICFFLVPLLYIVPTFIRSK